MFHPLPHSTCYHSNRNTMRKCNYRAEMTVLSVGRLAGSGVGIAPKYPTVGERRRAPNRNRFCDDLQTHRHSMTRHSHYHGDKMSRPALPLKLRKRRHGCEIRSLTEGNRRGAHFAEMFDAHPFFIPQDNSVADMTDTV